jgi:hypothetical protein
LPQVGSLTIPLTDIAWTVALLLQFGPDASQIKAAADVPAVDQGQALRGGHGIGAFSSM